jgi:predicted DNA-binding transcriptional regulator AlpA
MAEQQELHEIIRSADLPRFIGLAQTAIWELRHDKKSGFPKPIPLSESGRNLGYLKSEVVAWQQRLIKFRDEGVVVGVPHPEPPPGLGRPKGVRRDPKTGEWRLPNGTLWRRKPKKRAAKKAPSKRALKKDRVAAVAARKTVRRAK